MWKKISMVALIVAGFTMASLQVYNKVEPAHALASWYDSSWMYRQQMTASNAGASPLSDFQVQVALNNTNFDFENALPSGADLRFVGVDNTTVYPHWFESYDPVGETALVWVKVPNIPASGGTFYYLYYGNPAATQGSDGAATFSFFDDFEDFDISDWTERFVSPSPTFFENDQIAILERSNNYGYIKRAFTGSFEGKTVEALMEIGHPNTSEYGSYTQLGETNHPRLTVQAAPTTAIGVGPVDYGGGGLPMDQRRYWNNGPQTSSGSAVFSFGWGDRIVDRISFVDSSTVQVALREESSSTWLEEADIAYTVSDLDNAEIALGKNPRENLASGGSFGLHQWDWVRVREYAATEPTSTVGTTVTSQDLFSTLSVDTTMPGARETEYTLTVTPNQPIPSGGEIRIDFPSSFNGSFDDTNFDTGALSIDAHGQITGGTFSIDRTNNIISYEFTSSTDVTNDIVIHIGDGPGGQVDLRHPSSNSPFGISITSYDAGDSELAIGEFELSTSDWWDTNWTYRTSLHINNQRVQTNLTNYAVRLDLSAANFDFTHAKTNGEDLRFISQTGAELSYWIESYSSGSETAVVWVKIPTVQSGKEHMITMYYGNAASSSNADATAVFDFADDFEDNDISDWTLVSETPGAITVASGTVSITEKSNNLGYLTRAYAGDLSGKLLEAELRLDSGSNFGEQYHPHIGYFESQTKNIGMGPVGYDSGTVPTDNMRTWRDGVRYDFSGSNYTTGDNVYLAMQTQDDEVLAISRRTNTASLLTSDSFAYDSTGYSSPAVVLGKRPFGATHSTSLGTGLVATHQWLWVRIRPFVYVEPSTSLGSEETNALPLLPSNVFINTEANGATTNAGDLLSLDNRSLALSAEFQDNDGADVATHYDLQILDTPTYQFWTIPSNIATFQPLSGNLAVGARSEDLLFSIPSAENRYARIRFYDDEGHVSPWTTPIHMKVPDTTGPSISMDTPTDGATGMSRDTNIELSIEDQVSDIETASYQVRIGAEDAIVNGACQAGFTCTINTTGQFGTVLIEPDAEFGYGETISVEATAGDRAGSIVILPTGTNATTESFSFFIEEEPVSTSTQSVSRGGGGGGGGGGSLGNLSTNTVWNQTVKRLEQESAKEVERESPQNPIRDITIGGMGEISISLTKNGAVLHGSGEQIDPGYATLIETLSDLYFPKTEVPALPALKKSIAANNGGRSELCTEFSPEYTYRLAPDTPKSLLDELSALQRFGLNLNTLGKEGAYIDFDQPLSRSSMLRFLFQMTCMDFDKDITEVPRFPDISEDHPNYLLIHLARKYGLVTGYLHDGLFRPDQPISQAEALKIALEFFSGADKRLEGTSEIFEFLDYSQWYGEYIRYASDAGVLRSGDVINPSKELNLGEVLSMLAKALTVRSLQE